MEDSHPGGPRRDQLRFLFDTLSMLKLANFLFTNSLVGLISGVIASLALAALAAASGDRLKGRMPSSGEMRPA